MAKAVELLEIISQSEQNRRIYEARQKELMDEAQRQYDSRIKGIEEGMQEGIKKGRKEGIKEGELKGKLEGKLEVAASLLDILSDEVIAEKTGLPLEKIKELRQ